MTLLYTSFLPYDPQLRLSGGISHQSYIRITQLFSLKNHLPFAPFKNLFPIGGGGGGTSSLNHRESFDGDFRPERKKKRKKQAFFFFFF